MIEISSTPDGLFANTFDLAFTVKSFSLIRNVEIRYRKKVPRYSPIPLHSIDRQALYMTNPRQTKTRHS